MNTITKITDLLWINMSYNDKMIAKDIADIYPKVSGLASTATDHNKPFPSDSSLRQLFAKVFQILNRPELSDYLPEDRRPIIVEEGKTTREEIGKTCYAVCEELDAAFIGLFIKSLLDGPDNGERRVAVVLSMMTRNRGQDRQFASDSKSAPYFGDAIKLRERIFNLMKLVYEEDRIGMELEHKLSGGTTKPAKAEKQDLEKPKEDRCPKSPIYTQPVEAIYPLQKDQIKELQIIILSRENRIKLFCPKKELKEFAAERSGFSDVRNNKKKYNKSWDLLKEIAEARGEIPYDSKKSMAISRLNGIFKERIIGINANLFVKDKRKFKAICICKNG